ncbi:MAG: hypothetical protein EOL87_02090 [Spartobacteria bacterium]|nr:hypothetical protein [Spartobacteria bacterium]
MKQQKILLTFTGSHDPFSGSVIDGMKQVGPVLSMLQGMMFDRVVLFGTPGMKRQTDDTVVAIQKMFESVAVEVKELSKLNNPTDHAMIMRYLRKFAVDIIDAYPESELVISISSGTPAMHACWLLLVADGTVPARIYSSYRPKLAGEPCRLEEIDLSRPEFPHIEPNVVTTSLDEEADMPGVDTICEELGIIGQDKPFLTAIDETARLAPYSCHILLPRKNYWAG